MADDALREQEALREVRRLRKRIRWDSRGRIAVMALVLTWIGFGFSSEVIPHRSPVNLFIFPIQLMIAGTVVLYLERTSQRFGGEKRPQILARYVLLHILSLALMVFGIPLIPGTESGNPYLVTFVYVFGIWAWPLAAAVIWKIWFGSGIPWLFGFITQMLVLAGFGALDLTWPHPWSGITQVVGWLAGGYVCLDSTIRRLRKRDSQGLPTNDQ